MIRPGIKNRGITLVETMIVVAILGIISSAVWILFVQGFRLWRTNVAQTEVQRDSRNILDIINRNLRQGISSSISISRNSVDDPPFSKISFTHINGKTFSYYQDGTEIYQDVDGTDSRLAQNVRRLTFSPVESGNTGVIGVSLCLEKGTYESKTRRTKLSIQKVRIMN